MLMSVLYKYGDTFFSEIDNMILWLLFCCCLVNGSPKILFRTTKIRLKEKNKKDLGSIENNYDF